jgi:hypothetical protein
LSSILFLTSCNKDLDQFSALPTPTYPIASALTAGKTLAANPQTSMYYKFVQKAGLELAFDDPTKTFTLFSVDNAGMRFFIDRYLASLPPAVGAPTLGAAVSDTRYSDTLNKYMTNALANSIVNYNVVGYTNGFVNTSTKIIPLATPTMPNKVFGSDLFLVNTQPFLRVPLNVTSSLPYSYANNIPVTVPDQIVANGVIHQIFTLVTPPSATLKTLIAAEPTLSYLRAAIARADSGVAAASKIDATLDVPLLNLTLLAPNDNAMRAVLDSNFYPGVYPQVYNFIYNTAIGGGASVAQATAIATAQAPAATRTQCTTLASNPANFNLLPVASVQGILAYHIFASNATGSFLPSERYFSVNFPSTASFIKTLVNSSSAPGASLHPGVRVQATFVGPSATAISFGGYGSLPSGGVASSNAPYTGPVANLVAGAGDKNAVNGVMHIINRVLLPQ